MVRSARRAFTLVELLVVVVIVLMVSALVLPTIVTSYREQHVVSAAAQVQAAVVAARDLAARTGRPAGFRLLPDEAFALARLADGTIDVTLPLASNAWVPIETPPRYAEGLVSIYPYSAASPYPLPLPSPVLVLEQAPRDAAGAMAAPTGWAWNIRVGDRVTVGSGRRRYTVVGPMVVPPGGTIVGGAFYANADLYVNYGPPEVLSLLDRGEGPAEYLWLVNGQDDDGDGWTDNGWDGVTQSFAPGLYEMERWEPSLAGGVRGVPYSIDRRPVPSAGQAVQYLPASAVIDLTGWATTRSRSRLPVNPYTGSVDVLVDSRGRLVPTPLYSSPDSVSLGGEWLHFWVGDRADVGIPPTGDARLVSLNGRTGRIGILDPAGDPDPHGAAMRGE